MVALNTGFWSNRTVFITGHMGFKGAWLCALLSRLGAKTVGFGFDRRAVLLYREMSIAGHSANEGDVTDYASLKAALEDAKPDIVVHLAAQPIVLTSYNQPLQTFKDNIMGTACLLEAIRYVPGIEASVIITSDKVYKDRNRIWAYGEDDPLGGLDPYSASKAAAEIVAQAMIASFYGGPESPKVATARAGNVIGGGDWAEFRLLPDAARALGRGEPLVVRNPDSTRPWQHVLDPLAGYLLLAQALVEGRAEGHTAWNFGPDPDDALTVRDIAGLFVSAWGADARWVPACSSPAPKEAHFLSVDSERARRCLGWRPKWRVAEAVGRTAAWYRAARAGVDPNELISRDIDAFLANL
jgi:CDP-glucose 4,6-dehydratase